MGLDDLTVLGLKKVGLDSVQNSGNSEGEGSGMSVGVDSCENERTKSSQFSLFLFSSLPSDHAKQGKEDSPSPPASTPINLTLFSGMKS